MIQYIYGHLYKVFQFQVQISISRLTWFCSSKKVYKKLFDTFSSQAQLIKVSIELRHHYNQRCNITSNQPNQPIIKTNILILSLTQLSPNLLCIYNGQSCIHQKKDPYPWKNVSPKPTKNQV